MPKIKEKADEKKSNHHDSKHRASDDDVCCYYTGLITYLDTQLGLIDESIYFVVEKQTVDLSVGNLVHATVFHAPYKQYKLKAVSIKQLVGICVVTRTRKNKNRKVSYKAAKILDEPKRNKTKIIYFKIENNSHKQETLNKVRLLEQDSAFNIASVCDNTGRGMNAQIPIVLSYGDSIFIKICYQNAHNRKKYANLNLIFDDWEFRETLVFHPYEWTYGDGNNMHKSKSPTRQTKSNIDLWLLHRDKAKQKGMTFQGSGYDPPKILKHAAQKGIEHLRTIEPLNQPLSTSNYEKKFHYLLYLEEMAQDIDSHSYDLDQIRLENGSQSSSFHFSVNGRRLPKVKKDDKIIINLSTIATIENIEENKVTLKGDEDLVKKYQGETCLIHFVLDKSVFCKLHSAVSKTNMLDRLTLFPETHKLEKKRSNKRIDEWFNKQLNSEQKRAVNGIIKGQYKPLPYIVFGPPGTGKTSTIVEAVIQIFQRCSANKILICAPSNAAADVLCKKLIESNLFNKNNLVRLYAYSYCLDHISLPVKRFAEIVPGEFSNQVIKILITTCVTAYLFHQNPKRNLKFTHIFVDEASQATEPETLIPLTLATKNTFLILSGDPFQLGPVIFSQHAKEFGLATSLMERLMKLQLYSKQQDGKYSDSVITKLLYSFRFKDKRLLQLPSRLFYENELISSRRPCSENASTSVQSPLEFPLIFRSVNGTAFKDISMSWSNPPEVLYVYYYVLQLKHHGFNEKDIGIITPYHRQVEKIKTSLDRFGISGDIKVGSVEEFQGDEKEAIIISTVRTIPVQPSQKNMKNAIGFVQDAKRFNVSLTRSKSILIIIGDDRALVTDQNWDVLIQFCKANNAFL